MGREKRKWRTRDDIIADMLQTCALKGISKTRIMLLCHLSYAQLCNYLKLLTGKGLLEEKIKLKKNKKRKTFITSEKGKKWFSLYQQLRELEK